MFGLGRAGWQSSRAKLAPVEEISRAIKRACHLSCEASRRMPLEIINLVIGLAFLAIWILVSNFLVRQI